MDNGSAVHDLAVTCAWRRTLSPPPSPECKARVQVTFTDANHWLYLEEPEKFNKLIRDFVVQGLPAVAKHDQL